MKILIIDTYYRGFLKTFYNKSDTDRLSYSKHRDLLLSQSFGTSDAYSYYLKKHGCNAEEVIANDDLLQIKWAKENRIKIKANKYLSKIQLLPFIHRFINRPDWVQKIVLEQIKKFKPDTVYLQDLSILNPSTLRKIKKNHFLVGQIACPLPAKKYLKEFQLILTSFPNYVRLFRKMGINSEYFKIGFDPRVLKRVQKKKRTYNVTFVGGISPHHKKGLRLLKAVADKIRIDIWGYGKEYLTPGSKLYKYHHGEAWAIDMYKILAKSKITINRHIDVAKNYANNMRLFEATGMGTLLITDRKSNLKDFFKINKEVVEYKNEADLIQKINYYLKHPRVRKKIAAAGQKRTLKDHSYDLRMKELIKIIERYCPIGDQL